MQDLKDNILDFIEDHRVLCIIGIVVVIIICILFGIRSNNLKKKEAEELAQMQAQALAEAQSQSSLEQDVEEEKVPENKYQNSLGLDANKNKDERIEIVEQEPEPIITVSPVQTKPTYDTVVTIFDHTDVPKRNMDGSSCKAYQSKVKLADFGTYWGTELTEDDLKGGDFYMVGVEQNPDDILMGDLQSTGWLISNFNNLNDNDAIKFTNLHVIGSLSTSHVALLCSYDWYSAFGMDDTLVVFEDISDTLKVSDFSDGDIFSATVYKHNIQILDNVKGQRVIVVQFAVFK